MYEKQKSSTTRPSLQPVSFPTVIRFLRPYCAADWHPITVPLRPCHFFHLNRRLVGGPITPHHPIPPPCAARGEPQSFPQVAITTGQRGSPQGPLHSFALYFIHLPMAICCSIDHGHVSLVVANHQSTNPRLPRSNPINRSSPLHRLTPLLPSPLLSKILVFLFMF